jgi:signal transduction histidine kinase/HPt (histidine-containing phosphotransfer) domain-containing protein
MSGPESASVDETESDGSPGADAAARAIFAGRIDLLYSLGRHYLFLPFSALCLAGVVYENILPLWLAIIPLLLQIAVTVVTGRLGLAYRRRPETDDPHKWADRYTMISAAAGAAWGVGAVIWFDPHSFSAEAYLTVAFLGMTAVEFIARCAHRPAYLAHAAFSLGPLAIMLQLERHTYAMMSSVLVLFFGGVLYSYCEGIAGTIEESIRLKRDNALLMRRLAREKHDAVLARDAAEASTRAKSAFIANISHEIRTPLNALLGMAQLLERSDLDHGQKGHVKVILEAGRGLKTLLDDVIALSRDEHGDEAVSEEDCDPAQAARTVVRLLQPRAWEKQLRLTVTAGPNLPRVAADPRRVRQVLLKLADNAVKFTERGGVEIRIEARAREDGGQMLHFAVCDTGHGLAPELTRHIFEPFTSGDNSYARRNDGAGLGLAVAKRVVESMGGSIGFDSEPGAGANFWFTVPATRAVLAERAETAPIAADSAPPSGLTLLIATGDDAMRSQLGNLLEPFGNRLFYAATTIDAIALAGRQEFDAILAHAPAADSLVAAPGVKAPLLALVTAGQRTPAAASDVLRWPATAGAVYGALGHMLGRGSNMSGHASNKQGEAIAAIDAPAFAALEKSLGLTTLIEILQSYVKTAEELCGALSSASEHESWDDAARIAQDIAGAAGSLGLTALTSAARGFTQKAREGEAADGLHNAADSVVAEHERVRKALANLYPDLAA